MTSHRAFFAWVAATVLCVSLLSLNAFAGKGGMDVGGGGTGVNESGQTYLLDLYDYGLKDKAFISEVRDESFEISLSQKLSCAELPCDLLSRKLKELEHLDPVFAAYTLEAIKALTWSFSDAKLKSTDDVGPTLSDVSPVQIAVRQGSLVIIQAERWAEMNSVHQAALILHEAFAALSGGKMTSPQIRRALAAAFDPKFESISIETFNEVMDQLPSSRSVAAKYSLPARGVDYHARTVLQDWETAHGRIYRRTISVLYPELMLEFVQKPFGEKLFYKFWPIDSEKACDLKTPHSDLASIEDVINIRFVNYEASVALMPPAEAEGAFLAWSLKKYESVIMKLAVDKKPFQPGLNYGEVTVKCSAQNKNAFSQFAEWGKTFVRPKLSAEL